ncbi:hypothetical protein SASPL_137556 [Salvia splendens]|uniref:EF-hand domain-containing protein n=2 Tax=Salvia splendens TaxID=180675 RepID=A0A8X8WTV8_SALSN|nr:hypothetical protein SASPL_137556 [Salvia splendens]
MWSRPWKEYGLERVVVAGLPYLDDDSATEEMLEQRVQCGETWVVTAGQRQDRLTLTPQRWRWDLAGMDCGVRGGYWIVEWIQISMEKYARVFNRFDSNGYGKVCPAELQRCVAAIVGEMTEEEAAAVVALMDSDGDGLLSLEDLMRVVEDAAEEEKASDLREAFKMYEMEGSGCITPSSLRRMLSRLGERRSVDQCGDMIAAYDLNADGVLTFDEFKVMMASSPSAAA